MKTKLPAGMLICASMVTAALSAVGEDKSFDDFFQRGRFEATLTSGALFSPFIAIKNRPVINYSLSEVQLGYMLTDVNHAGWFKGNLELVGEGFAGAVFEGRGSYISGITAWLRYNFVPENWRLVPFAQAGMGLTFTDANKIVVGETFNFNLELGAGVRYFVSQNWSVNLEYRYQHISNANISRNNLGINAHGPMLGVSYFF
jgi:opacity protein-like surface antigen